jgi:hypothetical protein
MLIIWSCATVGLSLLLLVLYQISLGNIADGPQIGASISLIVFSLVAWSQSRGIDESMTVQPPPQDPFPQRSGMRYVGQGELIPEEAYCTVCGGNMSETRNEDGGAMVCTYSDCGHWYHRDHFNNIAIGSCQSPQCRRRR